MSVDNHTPEKKELSRHFSLAYPNSLSLNYSYYYKDIKYNHIRRCKIILFGQCLNTSYDNKIGDDIIHIKKKYVKDLFLSLHMDSNVMKEINKYYSQNHIIKNM
jgi:hypothetical protein